MQKIKKLSQHEAQKIAAGEVVERPANVVKELLENALDAGATHISLFIQDGGKQLIRVVDNGSGMSPEDAKICFEHHATSKILSVHDLDTITTFGFRGEALSSISSVSNVKLITKEQDATEATQLILEKGLITNTSITSAPTGTDISIENLFENVPARKKFLKKRETEWRHIQLLFQAFCLDYAHIHFKLFSENKQIINCAPSDTTKERSAQLWDHDLAPHIIPIKGENPQASLKLHGIISDHQHMKYDRNSIFFFVNNRWVKNYQLSRALLKGYNNVLPAGRFPMAVIFIELDAHQVDINIHPRKEEVQFLHPLKIEHLITQLVKSTLEQNISKQIKQENPFFHPPVEPFPTPQQFTTTAHIVENFKSPFIEPLVAPKIQRQEHVLPNQAQSIVHTTVTHDYELLCQYKKTYILLEKEDGLLFVDQHAAHERILYEQFSKRFENIATTHLMFPQTIMLKEDDFALIEPHLNLFIENGINIEVLGNNQITITATPVHLKNASLDELVHQTIGWLKDYATIDQQELFKAVNEKLHTQMACKAAVKAGDILDRNKMQQLLDDLDRTENRFACPHGRPTMWLLHIDELEKKFRRDYRK